MEAIAMFAFKPTQPDELGFTKGSILNIIEMEEDPNWYKAKRGNQEGMIPKNYISLYPHPWYVPKCSRREAELRLLEIDPEKNKDLQPDGAFILRQSENDLGQFSISVKEGSSVLHFRVFSDPDGKYHIWTNKFQSINELVDHHRRQTIYWVRTLLLRDCVPSMRFGPTGSGPDAVFPDAKQISQKSSKEVPRGSDLSKQASTSNTVMQDTVSLPPGILTTSLTGRYCVAKFDFVAEFEGELSFRRWDHLLILGEEDENWWYAEFCSSHPDLPYSSGRDKSSTAGLRGLIPANYVDLLPANAAIPAQTQQSSNINNSNARSTRAR